MDQEPMFDRVPDEGEEVGTTPEPDDEGFEDDEDAGEDDDDEQWEE